MMNFMELVQARESCRSYQDKPVTREQQIISQRLQCTAVEISGD